MTEKAYCSENLPLPLFFKEGNSFLLYIIDHKMTMQKAIDAPRIHCEAGKEIFIESRIPKEVQDGLIRNGYKLVVKKDFDLYFGGTQGVMIDPKTGKPYGGADPRREGSVMGY